MTKDYLQQKRFQAQSNGTTYVYDIPDMFRQMTERLWKEYSMARPTIEVRIPEKILIECVELVLEGDTLVEMKRLPGENTVSFLLEHDFFCNLLKICFFFCNSSVVWWLGALFWPLPNILRDVKLL